MVGNHTMMANQAAMVNTGEGDGCGRSMFSDMQRKRFTTHNFFAFLLMTSHEYLTLNADAARFLPDTMAFAVVGTLWYSHF